MRIDGHLRFPAPVGCRVVRVIAAGAVTLPMLPAGAGSGREAMLAAGVALAAGCATGVVRSWEAGWRGALMAALIFGLTPALIAVVEDAITPVTAVLPPAVLLLTNELLVRQRIPWWLLGPVLGFAAALAPMRDLTVLVAAGIALCTTMLVVALLRPDDTPLGVSNVVRAAIAALPAALLALAYPIVIDMSAPGRVTVAVADHHTGMLSAVTGVFAGMGGWFRDQIGSSSPLPWLASGAVGAVVVGRLRRTRAG